MRYCIIYLSTTHRKDLLTPVLRFTVDINCAIPNSTDYSTYKLLQGLSIVGSCFINELLCMDNTHIFSAILLL